MGLTGKCGYCEQLVKLNRAEWTGSYGNVHKMCLEFLRKKNFSKNSKRRF